GRRDRPLHALAARHEAAARADDPLLLVARAHGRRPGGRNPFLLGALRLAEDRRGAVADGHLPDVRQRRRHLRRHGQEAEGLPGATAVALLRQDRRPRRRDRARETGWRPGDAWPDGSPRRRPRRAMHGPAARALRAAREVESGWTPRRWVQRRGTRGAAKSGARPRVPIAPRPPRTRAAPPDPAATP